MQLQELLDTLKKKRNDLEKVKKELNKDGRILSGELKDVNIEEISPTSLEKFDTEIVRLKELTDN